MHTYIYIYIWASLHIWTHFKDWRCCWFPLTCGPPGRFSKQNAIWSNDCASNTHIEILCKKACRVVEPWPECQPELCYIWRWWSLEISWPCRTALLCVWRCGLGCVFYACFNLHTYQHMLGAIHIYIYIFHNPGRVFLRLPKRRRQLRHCHGVVGGRRACHSHIQQLYRHPTSIQASYTLSPDTRNASPDAQNTGSGTQTQVQTPKYKSRQPNTSPDAQNTSPGTQKYMSRRPKYVF